MMPNSTAYLFQCARTDLFGITRDPTGADLPTVECSEHWVFRSEVALDGPDPSLSGLDLLEILKAMKLYGYYIWRESDLK